MAVPQHDWRSLVRQSAVALLLLLPLCIIYWHSISGDAAIYFTFVKRFFELPFSYQPHQVSFGATSPLHVVLHAPLYLMFGDPAWLSVSKALSLALIPVGVTVINRAIRGTTSTLILGCLLAAINAELFITAAELFETSLAFAIIALLFCSLVENRIRVAALLTGLLYLVRPELALVAVPIAAIGARHLSGQRANRRDVLPVVVLVVAPAVLYHAYIWLMSGALLPSSVYARSLTAMETTLPWTARLKQSWSGLRPSERWFYGIGGVTATAVVASGRARAYLFELIFLIPIAVLYVFEPPLSYLSRYLLPIAPAVLMLAMRVFLASEMLLRRRLGPTARWATVVAINTTLVLGLFVAAVDAYPYRQHPRYDYPTLLLRDLSAVLNPMTSGRDEVLIYEIQAQYYLNARCLSADGIVGNQLFDVLTGKESFEQFISHRVDLRYVVTMHSFNYRHLYAGTLLERLYVHDLASPVGAVMRSGDLQFVKVATNPVFSNPQLYQEVPFASLNNGTTLRLFGDWNPRWSGHSPFWNSVYQVQR